MQWAKSNTQKETSKKKLAKIDEHEVTSKK